MAKKRDYQLIMAQHLGFLLVHEGRRQRQTALYLLRLLPSDFGRAFALSLVTRQLDQVSHPFLKRMALKALAGRERERLLSGLGRRLQAESGTGYDVLLHGRRSCCECAGWLRWGKCLHLEALRMLRRRRLLPEREKTSKEEQP